MSDESAWAKLDADGPFAAMRAKLPRPVWRCEPASSDPADVKLAAIMEAAMNAPGGPVEKHYDAFIKAEVARVLNGTAAQ